MELRTSGRCFNGGLKGTYVAVEPFHLFRYGTSSYSNTIMVAPNKHQ